MTAEFPLDVRRIIPRWRNSRNAFSTGELISSRFKKRLPVKSYDQFNEKLLLWRENGTIEIAADLVSSGLSEGKITESVDAAFFLLGNKENVTPAVLSLAEEILVRAGELGVKNKNNIPTNAIEKQTQREIIHNLRVSLNLYPRNPIMWVDLARAYIVLGQHIQAQEAMIRAQALAPDNRFVLRSASRLFVHLDRPDIAHDLLVRRDITRKDPWLLAAEIATAMVGGFTSKYIRDSRDILEQRTFHPFHTAELASALGSIELSNGYTRRAKKLFQASLINPTENSVAQSVWAKNMLPSLEVEPAISSTPGTYEAQALHAFFVLDWDGVVQSSLDWFFDEPYSSRSAELGTYAACVGLDNFEYAVNISRQALIANPNDQGLINNLAFALANLNQLDDSMVVLKSAMRPASRISTEVALKATEGLINLRLGNLELGRSQYLDAIAYASTHGLDRVRALATVYYVQEMVRAGQMNYLTGIEFAHQETSKYTDPQILWLLKKLEKIRPNI